MRLSIIVPYLNSHAVVKRQVLHFRRMRLPDDVEILFMDDGSDPPLSVTDPPPNFRLIPTNDFRPWTSSLARNTAARHFARGEYLLMMDGDYIILEDAILRARDFDGDRLGFRRQFGVLTEDGVFTQDRDVLLAYGLPLEKYEAKGVSMPPHPNNFVIRAALFHEMGGYREDLIVTTPYPHGEDNDLKRTWKRFVARGKAVEPPNDLRPTIYMFPNGQFCGDVDFNPFGLFHNLSRKTARNRRYVST